MAPPEQVCGRGPGKKEARTRPSKRTGSKTSHGPHSDELPPGHPPAWGIPHPGSGGWQQLSSLTALGVLESQAREHKLSPSGAHPSPQPRRAPGGPPSQHELHRRLRAFGENTE